MQRLRWFAAKSGHVEDSYCAVDGCMDPDSLLLHTAPVGFHYSLKDMGVVVQMELRKEGCGSHRPRRRLLR